MTDDVRDDPADLEQSEYQRAQDSPEFQELRRRFRVFVFPMTALFLVWYFTYVLLANYAHGFMNKHVKLLWIDFGRVSVGFLFAFGQFISTALITLTYVRWTNKKFDPKADALRQQIESKLEGSAS